MPTYICEKCGCIDNTACGGNYWTKDLKIYDDYANAHALCVECTPDIYNDGSKNDEAGKWHNKFPKEHWSKCGTKEEILKECDKDEGNFINAKDYFEKLSNK